MRIPPGDLVGVLTEVPDDLGTGPTAILLNVANQHHIGPNRLWVELARQWASDGIRALRVDLSGLGTARVGTPTPARGSLTSPRRSTTSWTRRVGEPGRSLQRRSRAAVCLGLPGPGQCPSAPPPWRRRRQSEHDVPSGGKTRRTAPRPRRRIVLPKDAVANTFREGGRLSWLRQRYPNLAWWVRVLGSPRRRSGRGWHSSRGRGPRCCSCAVRSRAGRFATASRVGSCAASSVAAACVSSGFPTSTTSCSSRRNGMPCEVSWPTTSCLASFPRPARTAVGMAVTPPMTPTDHGADTQPALRPDVVRPRSATSPGAAPLGPTPRDRQQTGPPSA